MDSIFTGIIMFNEFVQFVRDLYKTNGQIPLHAPVFIGNEKKYLLKTIESTFVSSVGGYVSEFEQAVAEYTGAKYAIATVNGTSALHIALLMAGVKPGGEVITQSLTFVATCNSIRYCGAKPIFIDVENKNMGLSYISLQAFLDEHAEVRDDGLCWNKKTNRPIQACVPMHTYGFPVALDEIRALCDRYNISLVEDAAESLGSYYHGRHTGTIGQLAAISFNGNKIITTGGGGMILTNDSLLAQKAKHLTTTAKISHTWEFDHDRLGYNYRLPNLNAALGVAQMEMLPQFVEFKRKLAFQYHQWAKDAHVDFATEKQGTKCNYWLNILLVSDRKQRDAILKHTNENKVMTRPAWVPMHRLLINKGCQCTDMSNTERMYDRIVCVPSGVAMQLNQGFKGLEKTVIKL